MLCDLVDRSFEAQMKYGDQIHIRDASNPAVRVKSEDTTATWSNITDTMQTITINRQVYCAMLFESIAELGRAA